MSFGLLAGQGVGLCLEESSMFGVCLPHVPGKTRRAFISLGPLVKLGQDARSAGMVPTVHRFDHIQKGETSMKIARVLIITALLLAATSLCLQAQERELQLHLKGVINDFTPITATAGTSPWELRGPWSFTVDRESGTAKFSARLTMELSDFGQTVTSVNAVARLQHTHRITMTTNTVIYNPTDCPPAPLSTPPYTARIEITGTANIEANGSPAPFGPSALQVCIAGGSNMEFSNITLVFTGDSGATAHFGPQAIHGLVRKAQ
jgi:hypothetical protein